MCNGQIRVTARSVLNGRRLRQRARAGGPIADFRYACRMLSLVLSTIAFFVASFFIKRWLDDMDIPKTMTRNIVIFVAAAAVSYGVAFVVDLVIS